ncbi:hypothetical protein Tco_0412342 [Tanacetum coccineum]
MKACVNRSNGSKNKKISSLWRSTFSFSVYGNRGLALGDDHPDEDRGHLLNCFVPNVNLEACSSDLNSLVETPDFAVRSMLQERYRTVMAPLLADLRLRLMTIRSRYHQYLIDTRIAPIMLPNVRNNSPGLFGPGEESGEEREENGVEDMASKMLMP